MQTVLHYWELRHWLKHHAINTPIAITVEQLAGVWHCTVRDVKAMIGKHGYTVPRPCLGEPSTGQGVDLYLRKGIMRSL